MMENILAPPSPASEKTVLSSAMYHAFDCPEEFVLQKKISLTSQDFACTQTDSDYIEYAHRFKPSLSNLRTLKKKPPEIRQHT